MSDVPKIVPIDLSKSLLSAAKAHSDLRQTIADHSRAASIRRAEDHAKLSAENQLKVSS